MGASEPWPFVPRRFTWLGPGRMPAALDLRRRGWLLIRKGVPGPGCPGLRRAWPHDGCDTGITDALRAEHAPELRRFLVIWGVESPVDRALLLEAGFGDAVSAAMPIEELAARSLRVDTLSAWVPRLRDFGALKLDLVSRSAIGHGKPLNLNPREFALLWRLAESPNQKISKQVLIRDVWRMGFMPRTNSIAVHMSRLRRKLGFAGLEDMIETAFQGGYRLRMPSIADPQSALAAARPPLPEPSDLSRAAPVRRDRRAY